MVSRVTGYRLMVGGALATILAASRFLLAPKYLYYFDSVNFALALTDFDPVRHQPQPPGYPLFVGLSRVVYWFVPSPQQALVWTGILGSLTAMLLVWLLGRAMFGDRAGLCAALLLLFHPAFWFGGLTNQVRVFLAVGAAATMLAVWRSLSRDDSRARWFYLAVAAAAGMSGFRPLLVVFLAPLIIWSGLRARRSGKQWLVAAAILLACVMSWLSVVIIAVKGPTQFVELLRQYSSEQFSGTSVIWGSSLRSALRMLTMSVIWYFLPVLSWIWAVPLTWRRLGPLKEPATFLALSFVPAFLFHSFVHVGDPDHTLTGAPALCVLGGFILSRLDHVRLAAAAAVALNVLLFFSPPRGIPRACSYSVVQQIDRTTRATIQAVEELGRTQPLVLVALDHLITWRHLYYYFPQHLLVVLHDSPKKDQPGAPWRIRQRQLLNSTVEASRVPLPAGSRVVWFVSPDTRRQLEKELPIEGHGPLPYSEATAGSRFRLGSYGFLVDR